MAISPAEVYQDIVESTPPDLQVEVLEIIRRHVGKDNRISRPELIYMIFGIDPKDIPNLSNSTYDRQIRDAIEVLQDQYPIISSSGTGGYWYAAGMDELNAYAAEINSRALKLLEKSRRLLGMADELYFEMTQNRLPGF